MTIKAKAIDNDGNFLDIDVFVEEVEGIYDEAGEYYPAAYTEDKIYADMVGFGTDILNFNGDVIPDLAVGPRKKETL